MSYQLGMTYPPSTLTSPVPNPADYVGYTNIAGPNGRGEPVYMGHPTLTWSWAWLLQADFNTLVSMLGGETSARVFITSKLPDGTFQTFSAVMWTPTSVYAPGGRRGNVQVKFTQLDAEPAFSSGVVQDAADTVVKVTFSGDMYASDYSNGVTIKVATVAATISSADRQTDKSQVWYTLSAPVTVGQAVTWEYSKASGDYASYPGGTLLENQSAQTITNSVV